MSPVKRQYYCSSTKWRSGKKKMDKVNIKKLKNISVNNDELIWTDSVLLSKKKYFSHPDLSHWEHWVNWLLHRERVSFKSDQSLTAKIILSACLKLLDLLWQSCTVKARLSDELNCQTRIHLSVSRSHVFFLPSLRTLHPLIWFFMNRLTIFLVIRWSWS